MDLRRVSDRELLANTLKVVLREREVLMEVLYHLREIERRRLYSSLRQPSLFEYCVNVLKYSNAEADRRIKAMRMMKELPEVEEKLSSGELSLTNVAKAQEFFNQEKRVESLNVREKLEVLEKLENKSTREAEKILLRESSLPVPEVKERVRQVSPDISECKFGADEELMANMKRLRGRLAHKNPKMSMAELVAEAFRLALEATDPTKGTRAKKDIKKKESVEPKAKESSLPAPEVESLAEGSRRKYISVKLKREVWRETEGKCQNCRSEFAIEHDHIIPVSLGGSNYLENLRLLCRNCNQREAIVRLGQNTMDRYLT